MRIRGHNACGMLGLVTGISSPQSMVGIPNMGATELGCFPMLKSLCRPDTHTHTLTHTFCCCCCCFLVMYSSSLFDFLPRLYLTELLLHSPKNGCQESHAFSFYSVCKVCSGLKNTSPVVPSRESVSLMSEGSYRLWFGATDSH